MSVGKPWILKATYVDFGWESVAPLAASATIQLRHRRIEAEHCSDYQGLRILGNKLGAIEHGSYAGFRSIPLHDVGKITVSRLEEPVDRSSLERKPGRTCRDFL